MGTPARCSASRLRVVVCPSERSHRPERSGPLLEDLVAPGEDVGKHRCGEARRGRSLGEAV